MSELGLFEQSKVAVKRIRPPSRTKSVNSGSNSGILKLKTVRVSFFRSLVFDMLNLHDEGLNLQNFQEVVEHIGLEMKSTEVETVFKAINITGDGFIKQREIKKFLKSRL